MVAVTVLHTATATKIATPSIQAVAGWLEVDSKLCFKLPSIMIDNTAATIRILRVSSPNASKSRSHQPTDNGKFTFYFTLFPSIVSKTRFSRLKVILCSTDSQIRIWFQPFQNEIVSYELFIWPPPNDHSRSTSSQNFLSWERSIISASFSTSILNVSNMG